MKMKYSEIISTVLRKSEFEDRRSKTKCYYHESSGRCNYTGRQCYQVSRCAFYKEGINIYEKIHQEQYAKEFLNQKLPRIASRYSEDSDNIVVGSDFRRFKTNNRITKNKKQKKQDKKVKKDKKAKKKLPIFLLVTMNNEQFNSIHKNSNTVTLDLLFLDADSFYNSDKFFIKNVFIKVSHKYYRLKHIKNIDIIKSGNCITAHLSSSYEIASFSKYDPEHIIWNGEDYTFGDVKFVYEHTNK